MKLKKVIKKGIVPIRAQDLKSRLRLPFKTSAPNSDVAIEVVIKNDIFKRYTRVKYLLRVKHWRGRDVHSPFTYNLVREALMPNTPGYIVAPQLYSNLEQLMLPLSRINRICRVYSYLKFSSYTFDFLNYNNEDMVIVSSDITPNELDCLKSKIDLTSKRVCLVLLSLYETTQKHKIWQHITTSYNAVSIDLYYTGFVVFDKYLSKQCYKMRI